jgi:hypothetical protein
MTEMNPARYASTTARDVLALWQDSTGEEREMVGNGRFWQLRTPITLGATNGASGTASLLVMDVAGNLTGTLTLNASREVNMLMISEEGEHPVTSGLYYGPTFDEQPVLRDAPLTPRFDKMAWQKDGTTKEVSLQDNEGIREVSATVDSSLTLQAINVKEWGDSSQYTRIPVTPIDPGTDDGSRRLLPPVFTVTPSWETEPRKVMLRVKDQALDVATEEGNPEGTVRLGDSIPVEANQATASDELRGEAEIPRTVDGGFVRVGYTCSGYTNGYGFRWASLIKASPDVVASGTRVTLRLDAGFLNKDLVLPDPTQAYDPANPGAKHFNPKGDYVRFVSSTGGDVTETVTQYEQHQDDVERPKNLISIVAQRLRADGEHGAERQTLELDLELGSEVQAALHHIDVKLGAVKGVAAGLGAEHVGSNGGHRMKEALAVIAIRGLDTQDKDIGILAQASDPHPQIIIDPLTASDVQVDGYHATVRLCGTVRDLLADVTPGGAADITTVRIGLGERTVEVTAAEEDEFEDELRRPHAFKGRFDTTVTIPLADGPNVIRVSAENRIGNRSYATAVINAVVDLVPERTDPYDRDPGVMLAVQTLVTGFNPTSADTTSLIFPPQRVEGTVSGLETTASSRQFTGSINGNEITWSLGVAASTFSSVEVDAILLRLNGGAVIGEVINTLVESGPATGLFVPVAYEPLSISAVTSTSCHLVMGAQSMDLTRDISGEYRGTDSSGIAVRVRLDLPQAGQSEVPRVLVIRLLEGSGGPRVVAVEETQPDSGNFATVATTTFRRPTPYLESRIRQVVRSHAYETPSGTSTGVLMPIVIEVEAPEAVLLPENLKVDGQLIPLRTHPDRPDDPKRYSKRPLVFVHRQSLSWTSENVRPAEGGTGVVEVPDRAARQFAKGWSCDHPNDIPKVGRGLTTPITMVFADLPKPPAGTPPEAWTVQPAQPAGWTVGGQSEPPSVTDIAPSRLSKLLNLAPTVRVEMQVVVDATSAPAPGEVPDRRRYLNEGYQSSTNPNERWANLFLNGKEVSETLAFELVRPRIITWCVDGLGAYWFEKALRESKDVQSMFGKPDEGNLVRTAQAALPTITWCNWASIFTGLEPKDHGVYGNSFFRRDLPDEEPVFSGNDLEEHWLAGTKDGGDAAWGVLFHLNHLLREDVQTTYQQVAALPKAGSRSILTWYGKSSDVRVSYARQVLGPNAVEPLVPINFGAGSTTIIIPQTTPDASDAARGGIYEEIDWAGNVGDLINGHEPDGKTAQFTDAFSVCRLIEAWSRSNPEDLTCVYLPGPDNYGHSNARDSYSGTDGKDLERGNTKPYEHFVNHTARFMAGFHRKYVVEKGWSGATIYLLVSDHGQTVTANEGVYDSDKGRWKATLSQAFTKNVHARYCVEEDCNQPVEQLVQVIKTIEDREDNGLATWLRRDNADYRQNSVVISPNGGLMYLYVQNQGNGWSRLPQARVRELAGGLYEAATGTLRDRKGQSIYTEFKGALGQVPTIIVRDTAEWQGGSSNVLKVVVPNPQPEEGRPFALADLSLLASRNAFWVDVERRIRGLDDFSSGNSGTRCPDIIVIMNTAGGWNSVHEGDVLPGWHGGPSKADTMVPFALGFAGLRLDQGNDVIRQVFERAGSQRTSPNDQGPLQNRDMHKVMVDLLKELNP